MYQTIDNELRAEFLGINAMNPFDNHDSSSRRQMHASHLTQMLTLKKGDVKRIQSGMEREYGKYTFSVKMPVDAKILKIVPRYRRTLGMDSIKKNPETYLIYEEVTTKKLGFLSLPEYFSNHQYFGFPYVPTPALENLTVGSYVPKDTILLDSPAIDKQGNYNYGINANVAFMTHPATAEDGILVSESLLKRLQFETYEVRTVEWGTKDFLLNLYGDANNYKAFPDIGERVRDDGILVAARDYEDGLGVINQSVRGLMRVDHSFDRKVYAGSGGEIIDIRVEHDQANDSDDPTFGMDDQAKKYYQAKKQSLNDVLGLWKEVRRDKRSEPLVTPKFKDLLLQAMVEHDNDKQRIEKVYRNNKIDTWRVTFIIRNTITPTLGFKITDSNGGKGVIVKVEKDEHMPVDANGVRADIVIDPLSIPARTNIGRMLEHYLGSVNLELDKRVRDLLAVTPSTPNLQGLVQDKLFTNPDLISKIWYMLYNYYSIVSSEMHEIYSPYASSYDDPIVIRHIADVCKNGIGMYVATDNKRDTMWMIDQIEKQYKPLYGPVTYTDSNGKRVTTKTNVRIGYFYFILLEKIADDGMAIGTGKRQHYGVVAPNTSADKYSTPIKQQAVRGLGEAEVRIVLSYAGERAIVELLDRYNSAATHKHMLQNILASRTPTNIDKIVDRSVIPYGGSKPLAYVNHMFACAGIKFVYKPFTGI